MERHRSLSRKQPRSEWYWSPRSRTRKAAKRTTTKFSLLRVESLEPRRLLSTDLYVTRLTPLGASGHPFDLLDIQFSKAVQDASFTLASRQVRIRAGTITPPSGALTPVGSTPTSEYHLALTGLTGLSTYSLSIGPNVLVTDDGLPMNQNHMRYAGQRLPGGPVLVVGHDRD